MSHSSPAIKTFLPLRIYSATQPGLIWSQPHDDEGTPVRYILLLNFVFYMSLLLIA